MYSQLPRFSLVPVRFLTKRLWAVHAWVFLAITSFTVPVTPHCQESFNGVQLACVTFPGT